MGTNSDSECVLVETIWGWPRIIWVMFWAFDRLTFQLPRVEKMPRFIWEQTSYRGYRGCEDKLITIGFWRPLPPPLRCLVSISIGLNSCSYLRLNGNSLRLIAAKILSLVAPMLVLQVDSFNLLPFRFFGLFADLHLQGPKFSADTTSSKRWCYKWVSWQLLPASPIWLPSLICRSFKRFRKAPIQSRSFMRSDLLAKLRSFLCHYTPYWSILRRSPTGQAMTQKILQTTLL